MLLALIAVASLAGTAQAATCGTSGIPFRFEVLPSGKPVLGCAAPTCFGAENGGRDVRHDAEFLSGAEGEDGFFREGDLARMRIRHPDAPSQQANCPRTFSAPSCSSPMTWVGGFEEDGEGSLGLQCCHYEGLKYAEEVGKPVVHAGEVYSGGEVLRDGRQTGFDVISNVKKITQADGSVGFELTVTRMNCLPNPAETENQVTFATHDISRILDKVADNAQGVQTNSVQSDQRLSPAAGDAYQQPPQDTPYVQQEEVPQETVEQFVQVGEQVVPVTSAGYYYPVASGVPACFHGDSQVITPSGIKLMKELQIGDSVLTSELNQTEFTKVISFMHRLPETRAAFIKLSADSHQLMLTPQHFIFKSDCLIEQMEMVYAEEVKEGDCIYVNHHDSYLRKVPVDKIEKLYATGVYAPMTQTGDIIVDNIYASCHNVIRSNSLAHTFLSLTSALQRNVQSLLGFFEDNGHLPPTSEFFLQVIDTIIPHKF